MPAEQDDLFHLLDRVSAGDYAAFASPYDATSSMVFGMVAAIISDRSLASEVTLDIYIEAWLSAPFFDPSRIHPTNWLRSLAVRRLAETVGDTGGHSS